MEPHGWQKWEGLKAPDVWSFTPLGPKSSFDLSRWPLSSIFFFPKLMGLLGFVKKTLEAFQHMVVHAGESGAFADSSTATSNRPPRPPEPVSHVSPLRSAARNQGILGTTEPGAIVTWKYDGRRTGQGRQGFVWDQRGLRYLCIVLV